MEYSTLYDLITHLEHGTKLHIGFYFFGNYHNSKLTLPVPHIMHANAVCDEFKKAPKGLARCFRCRNAVIKKSISTKKPFAGLCINGIYEYIRPVVDGDDLICIIFIGNIFPQGYDNKKAKRKLLTQNNTLLETMEKNIDFEQCDAIGALIESYIKMLMILCPPDTLSQKTNPLIQNIISFVTANLEYDVDISLLANLFHYSSQYLGRLFKEETGLSLREYINTQRIEHAKTLLLESSDKITDISLQVGFNNVTYFNRIFKQYAHITPREFRNRNQQSEKQPHVNGVRPVK